MTQEISQGFQKLLREPAFAQIATLMPQGAPQITQVWVDTDGTNILVNTSTTRQKTKNLHRDPRVAVNVVDPGNAWRYGTVRGKVVEFRTEGAEQHIDTLAKKYMGVDTYPNHDPNDPRVILVIEPDRIHEQGTE